MTPPYPGLCRSCLTLFLATYYAAAVAGGSQGLGGRHIAVTSDNDNYATRNDRHYSNGLRLFLGLPAGHRSAWHDWLGALLPAARDPGEREYTASLGQAIYTPEASASLLWRYGSFLPHRAGPVNVQPSVATSPVHFDYRPGRTDWQFYLGGYVRTVLHNLFLDGNTFSDSLSVEHKPLVWDTVAGVRFTFGKWRRPLQLTFNVVVQGKEFEGQEEIDRYGSITVSIPY